ncbi:MAG TPA: aspartate ammonia-lyase, partial [Nitrospirota bacterium]|nr:aspartate ammonia-lyase [Nitrospirota bacterium]
MTRYRIEKDLLGEREVPADALYGVHTLRSVENFPLSRRAVNPALIHAYGAVKLACARTNHELGWWDDEKANAIEQACSEMMEGLLDVHIVTDALQGGAGTSTNMNVNEVLANRALQLLGRPLGDYDAVGPLEDLNLHQSTNDTYPTALKVAAIQQLRVLEREVVALLEEFQAKEKAFAHVVKIGRTQLQDAVLVTLGREMSAYAEAFGRDRWRIYKCEERLRVMNLGGTAVGTGLAAPRKYIFRVIEHLRGITGLGLARAENLIEATQNTDVFVEVSGILKACASNLLKTSTDLRLLSSGPDAGIGEIRLPPRQAGSSIMPGKVNPVIPEAVSQAAMTVMANDQSISYACSLGNLELNAFMPLIADALLGNLDLLTNACSILRRNCIAGLEADEKRCRQYVE